MLGAARLSVIRASMVRAVPLSGERAAALRRSRKKLGVAFLPCQHAARRCQACSEWQAARAAQEACTRANAAARKNGPAVCVSRRLV